MYKDNLFFINFFSQNDELCELPPPLSNKDSNSSKRSRIRIKMKRNKSRDSTSSDSSQQLSQPQEQPQQPQQQTTDQSKAKRALFSVKGNQDSISSSHSSSTNSWKGADSVAVNGFTEPDSPASPLVVNNMSMNSLPSIGESSNEKSSRKQSLAHVFQEKLGTEFDETDETEGKNQVKSFMYVSE